MSYKVIVRNSAGEVFAETEGLPADELPGILKIMEKPSMFGTQEFKITVERL